MNPEASILISSAGRRVALLRAFRDALKRSKAGGQVLATDVSALAAAAHAADKAFEVPPCTDAGFVPRMLEICEQHRVKLVVPTIDTELATYAKHRDDFGRIGTRVLVGSPELVSIAADKRRTNRFLRENGLGCVYQWSPTEPSLSPLPVIAKPASGSASIGVHTIHDHDDLLTLKDDYVVEEIAPGVEYTMDVFVDLQGNCRSIIPRRRLEVRAGEVSKGVTERVPVIQAAVRDLVERLPGAVGVLTVQAFYDASSLRVSIIEINPRFGGGYPLSHAAGADFPSWLLQEVLGKPVTANDSDWLDGVLMLRFDDAIFVPPGGPARPRTRKVRQ